MTITDHTPSPFSSLEELREEHGELLKAMKKEVDQTGASASELAQRVVWFLTRVRATGSKLDFPSDREAAQSVLDYWTATLFTLPNGVSAASTLPSLIPGVTEETVNLQLEPFDPAALRDAAAAADAWLARPAADRVLARRILLRLVRLRADKPGFDAVPTVVAALTDLDTRERVTEVLAGLSNAGAIRLTRAGADDLERVALRSPVLMTEWATLKGWLAERVAFREEVERWDAKQWETRGRPLEELADGDRLDEARRYHDRNAAEREFVLESVKWQTYRLARADADRRAKWVWRTLAVVAVIGWVVAWIGWSRAATRADELTTANKELETANTELGVKSAALAKANEQIQREAELKVQAETARRVALEALAATETKSRAAVALVLTNPDPNARHVAKKILIVQSLGQVLFANTPGEQREALESWEQLRSQIRTEGGWFNSFLERHADKIRAITSATQATPGVRQAMIELSTSFREAIVGGGETRFLAPLASLQPIWYEQVGRAADKLEAAAKAGRPLSEVQVFSNLFWRLYSCELILVEDDKVASAMVAFGKRLKQWEAAPGQKVDEVTADALARDAEKLRDLFRAPSRAPARP